MRKDLSNAVGPILLRQSIVKCKRYKDNLVLNQNWAFFYHDKGCVKFLICIENAKLKNPRTQSSSINISKEDYIFQNAKNFKLEEIKNFTHQETFFVQSEIVALFSRYAQFFTANRSFLRQFQNRQGLHIRMKISSQCQVLTIAARGKILYNSLASEKNRFFLVIHVGRV